MDSSWLSQTQSKRSANWPPEPIGHDESTAGVDGEESLASPRDFLVSELLSSWQRDASSGATPIDTKPLPSKADAQSTKPGAVIEIRGEDVGTAVADLVGQNQVDVSDRRIGDP